MKRETFEDTAVFRRGFYQCPEEHLDPALNQREMGRMAVEPAPDNNFRQHILRRRRIHKKIRIFRWAIRAVSPPLRSRR